MQKLNIYSVGTLHLRGRKASRMRWGTEFLSHLAEVGRFGIDATALKESMAMTVQKGKERREKNEGDRTKSSSVSDGVRRSSSNQKPTEKGETTSQDTTTSVSKAVRVALGGGEGEGGVAKRTNGQDSERTIPRSCVGAASTCVDIQQCFALVLLHNWLNTHRRSLVDLFVAFATHSSTNLGHTTRPVLADISSMSSSKPLDQWRINLRAQDVYRELRQPLSIQNAAEQRRSKTLQARLLPPWLMKDKEGTHNYQNYHRHHPRARKDPQICHVPLPGELSGEDAAAQIFSLLYESHKRVRHQHQHHHGSQQEISNLDANSFISYLSLPGKYTYLLLQNTSQKKNYAHDRNHISYQLSPPERELHTAMLMRAPGWKARILRRAKQWITSASHYHTRERRGSSLFSSSSFQNHSPRRQQRRRHNLNGLHPSETKVEEDKRSAAYMFSLLCEAMKIAAPVGGGRGSVSFMKGSPRYGVTHPTLSNRGRHPEREMTGSIGGPSQASSSLSVEQFGTALQWMTQHVFPSVAVETSSRLEVIAARTLSVDEFCTIARLCDVEGNGKVDFQGFWRQVTSLLVPSVAVQSFLISVHDDDSTYPDPGVLLNVDRPGPRDVVRRVRDEQDALRKMLIPQNRIFGARDAGTLVRDVTEDRYEPEEDQSQITERREGQVQGEVLKNIDWRCNAIRRVQMVAARRHITMRQLFYSWATPGSFVKVRLSPKETSRGKTSKAFGRLRNNGSSAPPRAEPNLSFAEFVRGLESCGVAERASTVILRNAWDKDSNMKERKGREGMVGGTMHAHHGQGEYARTLSMAKCQVVGGRAAAAVGGAVVLVGGVGRVVVVVASVVFLVASSLLVVISHNKYLLCFYRWCGVDSK